MKVKSLSLLGLFALLLCGCDKPHEHEAKGGWSHNETQHYHECECGEIVDQADHDYKAPVIVNEPSNDKLGKHKYSCKVCSYSYFEEYGAIPTAPINFAGIPGSTYVDLSWEAPVSNGGKSIIRYEINVDESESWIQCGTETSYKVENLIDETEYAFKVRAINGIGNGIASESLKATPSAYPSAVQNLTYRPVSGRVELSWDAPLRFGDSELAGYQARLIRDGWPWTQISKNEHAMIEYLTNGVEYEFEVRAVNTNGKEGVISTIKGTPSDYAKEPTNVRFSVSDQKIDFRWEAPADNGGTPIKHYEVGIEVLSDEPFLPTTLNWVQSANEFSHSFEGLTNGTTYRFAVRAVNARGGGKHALDSATPTTTVFAPTNFRALVGDSSVVFYWDPPYDNDIYVGGTYTLVNIDTEDVKYATAEDGKEGYYVSGLENDREYTFHLMLTTYAEVGEMATATLKVTPHVLSNVEEFGAALNYSRNNYKGVYNGYSDTYDSNNVLQLRVDMENHQMEVNRRNSGSLGLVSLYTDGNMSTPNSFYYHQSHYEQKFSDGVFEKTVIHAKDANSFEELPGTEYVLSSSAHDEINVFLDIVPFSLLELKNEMFTSRTNGSELTQAVIVEEDINIIDNSARILTLDDASITYNSSFEEYTFTFACTTDRYSNYEENIISASYVAYGEFVFQFNKGTVSSFVN